MSSSVTGQEEEAGLSFPSGTLGTSRIWLTIVLGKKLSDRYEILSEIGRGGMGVVYRARDTVLNRHVAVKFISASHLSSDSEKRFLIEAQVVARMDHPSITPIFDFGSHDGALFYIMPVVPGRSLRQLIREQALRLGDVLDIGIMVAEALEHSHGHDVVHRDIKPENIMVSSDDEDGVLRIRVMDFGLAHQGDLSRMTKTGRLVGTTPYMSPEQVTGKTLDGRSDIYALATVLYECIANNPPFVGEMQSVLYRIVHELPQPPRVLGAVIDEEFEALILNCLEKDPDQRPAAAGDLARELRSLRANLRDSERNVSVFISKTVQMNAPILAPFVGRKAEFSELQHRLVSATSGECQLVALSGEPGVGKKRILQELEQLCAARRIRVLRGRFIEQDGSLPYHGFCEIFQEYFKQKESGSSPGEIPDMTDLGSDLVTLFPMLAEVDAVRAASSGTTLITDDGRPRLPENRTQVYELLARSLIRISEGKPLVLYFEELHRAGVALEAMQYIVRRLGPTPTLIVASYRSTEVQRRHPLSSFLENFQGDRRFLFLPLEPFTRSEHHEFIATLVGGTEVSEELARKLHEETEGNAFFTKELVRSLLDSGSIVKEESGAWTFSGRVEISTESLPVTIHQAVERRVSRLPDSHREVLAVAAVLGRSFDLRDLEAMMVDGDDLDELVDRLVHEGLFDELQRTRGEGIAFVSGIIREVIYGQISRRKRRSLHRKYARLLEKKAAGKIEIISAKLVHHFSEGDVAEKTVEYGLLHAAQALCAFSPTEAIRSIKTVVEFLDDDWEGDPLCEGDARILLSDAYQMIGDSESSLREAEKSIRIFSRGSEPKRSLAALLKGAKTAWQARRTDVTRGWVDQGLALSRVEGDPDTLSEFLSLAATVANLKGEYGQADEYQKEVERIQSRGGQITSREDIPQGGRLVVALSNQVVATHPVNTRRIEEQEVFANVFETLFAKDDEGNLVPHLCENWEVQQEGKSFLLMLRSYVRFQDGHPLTARDVKESFERAILKVAPNIPPVFAVIKGSLSFAAHQADEVVGLVIRSENVLEVQLEEALPLFPNLLTDNITGITRERESSKNLLGTGPFRLSHLDEEKVVLERHSEYWKSAPSNLDAVEFRHHLNASDMAKGLRAGQFDVVGDILPQDLEEVLRDPGFRRGLMETPRKFSYLLLFNCQSGPFASHREVREALSGVVRTRDIVWRTLGRLAQPAAGLIPPGILGHDPGRRRKFLTLEEGRLLLSSKKLPELIELKAAIHPLIQDRYGDFLKGIFSVWRLLGVEVVNQTPDMESFFSAYSKNQGFDFIVTRWAPDYEDPDNYTYTLFHSVTGFYKSYFSSEDVDRALERAREETQASVRDGKYREFDDMLLRERVILPLYHDVDCRIASPRVKGIKLTGTPPFVNYSEVGKAESVTAEGKSSGGSGVLTVPLSGKVHQLDPSLSNTQDHAEVLPCVFETLTRSFGEAQIVPWLAEEMKIEESGRRYTFRLRSNVSFHDGRRLSALDVRHSFERLLLNSRSRVRWLYRPIEGANELMRGKAEHLAGIRIHSATEFTIDLEVPIPFFPGLISSPSAAIVPEGTGSVGTNYRDGVVGTGPFRVARFDAGKRLRLERNPFYWRTGYPRSDGLVFSFGRSPEEIFQGFRDGQFSVAGDLNPRQVEDLRREIGLGAVFQETPRLSIDFVALNTRCGPFEDLATRQRFARAVDVQSLVKATLGNLAVPATRFIPPGLMDQEPAALDHGPSKSPGLSDAMGPEVEIRAAVHGAFRGAHGGFYEAWQVELKKAGFRLRISDATASDVFEKDRVSVDLWIGRYVADYPDADAFATILHTERGSVGRLCGSAEIDQLVLRGRHEMGREFRESTYAQIEEIVLGEARIVPLFHEQVYRFARQEVEGLSVSYWGSAVDYQKLRLRRR